MCMCVSADDIIQRGGKNGWVCGGGGGGGGEKKMGGGGGGGGEGGGEKKKKNTSQSAEPFLWMKGDGEVEFVYVLHSSPH